MKRKTVTAFLMSLCLVMTVPVTAYASEVQSVAAELQVQSAVEENQPDKAIAEDEPDKKEENGQTQEDKQDKAEQTQVKDEEASKKEKTSDDKKTENKVESKNTEAQIGEAQDELQQIADAVAKAVKQTDPDIASQTMQDFYTASDAYDKLSPDEKVKVPDATVKDLKTVRERIQKKIQTRDGITVSGLDWYAAVQVSDTALADKVLDAAKKQYPGCTPKIVYGKDITYTDVRDNSSYTQKDMASLTFPVPSGYDQLEKARVVCYADGKLSDLGAVRKEDMLSAEMIYPLENVFVIDTPVLLTGITMDADISINAGQRQQLAVHTVPENTTQTYQLIWSSDNTAVATVDSAGQVTALKEGTAHITATVTGTQMCASCTVTVVQGAHALPVSVDSILKETREYMLKTDKNPTIGSEWFALGLARSGLDKNSSYFTTYYNHVANYLAENKGKLTNTVKYTEYSKAIIVMTAMGKDARNIAGYNLFEPLADFDTVKAQGTNGPIWALIALNTNPAYAIPTVSGVKTQTTEQGLIDYILGKETSKGGWTMSGDAPDSDLTGMALQALAPYYQVKGYEKVTAAIDRALEALSTLQQQDGGYATMGIATSESTAQVLTALCALGIDPMQDARFVKGGSWTVENLLTYHISGSGFMHVKAGASNNGGGAAGEVNGMATEQAYYALTAYQRLLDGKTSLYDMSDIQLTKGDSGDGKGTGLENKDDDTKKDNIKNDDKKQDTIKKDDTKKDDTKKDTDKKTNTTANTKRKLTYKGKRLKLTGGTSGKKLTLSGNSRKKLTLADGTTTDGESSDGWAFEPEDYVENEEASGEKLTLSDLSAVEEAESPESAVTESQTGEETAESKDAAMDEGKQQINSQRTSLAVIGAAVLLVAVVIAGIFIYRKKKNFQR